MNKFYKTAANKSKRLRDYDVLYNSTAEQVLRSVCRNTRKAQHAT